MDSTRDWISLAGISYSVAKDNFGSEQYESGTELELDSSYEPYTKYNHGPPLLVEEDGLCRLTGRLKVNKDLPVYRHRIQDIEEYHGTIAILPSRCRPDKTLIFNTNLNEVPARVNIHSDGRVEWAKGFPVPASFVRKHKEFGIARFTRPDLNHRTWFSNRYLGDDWQDKPIWSIYDFRNIEHAFWLDLDGIFFSPDKGSSLNLADGVSDYGRGYRGPNIVRENGMCMINGLVRVNLTADETRHIATIPDKDCHPKARLIFQGNQHHDLSRLDIAKDGKIYAKASNPNIDWISLSGIVYAERERLILR